MSLGMRAVGELFGISAQIALRSATLRLRLSGPGWLAPLVSVSVNWLAPVVSSVFVRSLSSGWLCSSFAWASFLFVEAVSCSSLLKRRRLLFWSSSSSLPPSPPPASAPVACCGGLH